MVRLDRYDGLDLASYRRIVAGGEELEVSDDLLAEVERRRDALLRHLATGAAAYGVTTGLGYLAKVPVGEAEQEALQRSMLTARASGLGSPLPADVVRGAMLLRLTGFLSGFAGVSAALCRFLLERLNAGWSPIVPAGPYGAAGEIAPLAHLFQTFLGEGSMDVGGEIVAAGEALRKAGVAPYEPGPKEGLALVNGSPFATALAIHLGDRGRRLLERSLLAAALTLELTGVTARPYAERVAALSGDGPEQMASAALRELLGAGAATAGPQPSVSFRVVGQVLGALGRTLDELEATAERRLRSVTDSPLFLEEAPGEAEGLYPSGGFHALEATLRVEAVAVAVAHATNLAEKHLHRLLDGRFSGLPEQLAAEPGRQAGAVSLHKAVVSLTAANRLLAAPASVHALDTSSGQEDVQAHTFLATARLSEALDNHELALAYGFVALCQAAYLRGATPTAPMLAGAIERLTSAVAPIDEDRTLSPDVERVVALLREGHL